MSAVTVETPHEAARRLAARAIRNGFQPDALHCYCDGHGNPVFWRIRLKHPSKPKWMRPMYWNGEAYVFGEPAAPSDGKPLYRLPELLAANPAAPVWVVEGESCADALENLGMPATTSGGADSAGTADWSPLKGRRVYLWPDNDSAGRKYADAVTQRLRALGCAVEWVDVAILGLPDNGDCVDWLREHLTATAADVAALATTNAGRGGGPPNTGPRVILRLGSDVQPARVDWLWQGWLAAGKLQLIAGAPSTGKTTIATALAATVTMGGLWPDGSRAEAGSVVVWSGEDDNADTLNPRLRAAGADMTRVRVVDGVLLEDGRRAAFDPAHDLDALRQSLRAVPDVRLIVVDPIVSALSGDSHRNAEVRRDLQPLVDLAAEFRCALLGVTHFTKGTAGRDPVERITGSLAFGALARVVMVTAMQPASGDRPERRVLLRAKSNIGPDGGGFDYELQQVELAGFADVMASRVRWGGAVSGSAREILAEAEATGDDPGQDAAEFLTALLASGSRPAKDVFAEANAAGFSKDAMHRAKRKIGAVAVKQGMAMGWTWRLSKGGDGHPEDGEGGALICPPPSQPSTASPPSSADCEGMEIIDV